MLSADHLPLSRAYRESVDSIHALVCVFSSQSFLVLAKESLASGVFLSNLPFHCLSQTVSECVHLLFDEDELMMIL